MRRFFLSLILFICQLALFATHQRAGEITYSHVSGLTYRFTIITYTYTPSAADRPELEIEWGDGTSSIVQRTSKVNMANDISRNTYISEHTYPSTGTYAVSLEDPNRNNGILNIPNSVSVPFYLETVVVVNPFLGANSSPQLLNPPIDDGCRNVTYYHNPGAYDPDGDSLSYRLIDCRGYDGEDIPGYALPFASHSISIDAYTGDLIWDAPTTQGEYNIAILIEEWRHGVLIGSVVRDMQITISECENEPPEIYCVEDTCITAGETLTFSVVAEDPNSTSVALTATGGIFNFSQSHATFASAQGPPPVTGHFHWETECGHVKRAPYTVLFKAMDNGPQVNLTAFKSVTITVVAPKPENLTATPVGNTIALSWDRHVCDNAAGYRIYRREGGYDFEPDTCETGLPSYTGYQLIGTADNVDENFFIDDGSALPLNHGTEYCYRIVAYFADGAESYVSDETCALLNRDVPLLTNVDVVTTDPENGSIFLKWMTPKELDTLQFPGPQYEYQIFRATANQPGAFSLIHTNTALSDTTFTDNELNTSDLRYFYKIILRAEVQNEMVEVGPSDVASSIYLNIQPLDQALKLEWTETVPWHNVRYTVYRQDEALHQYDSIACVSENHFVDEHLTNGIQYCYYVESAGYYVAPDTAGPFMNRSETQCAVPSDITPPEMPQLVVTTDCENVDFAWTFSNDSAYLDVYQYFIHYKPTYNDPYSIIDSFFYDSDCYHDHCSYQLTDLPYITGCFSLSAIDTVGNRSALTPEICFDIDACSNYRLPNIITPNGDGVNDELVPFPYDNVAGVDFYLYDRWGRLIYKTNDIDIHWDGTDMYSHRPSSDGVYYYVCYVQLHSLKGVVTQELNGTVTVIR